jgi:hypothetical protein
MERYVELVAVAEVRHEVLRPVVGLRYEHTIAVARLHVGAERPEEGVRLGKSSAVCAFALV